jgi:hypothetical protein
MTEEGLDELIHKSEGGYDDFNLDDYRLPDIDISYFTVADEYKGDLPKEKNTDTEKTEKDGSVSVSQCPNCGLALK